MLHILVLDWRLKYLSSICFCGFMSGRNLNMSRGKNDISIGFKYTYAVKWQSYYVQSEEDENGSVSDRKEGVLSFFILPIVV